MKREFRQTAAIWSGVCVIYLAAFAVQFAVLAIVKHTTPSIRENAVFLLLLSTLPMYLVGLPLSLPVFRLAEPLPPAEKRRLSPLVFLGATAVCFAFALAGSLIGQVANNILSFLTGKPATNPVEELTRGVPLWLNILVVALIAPIVEETVYRKLVIDRVRRYGDVPAVLISALLFGAIHANFSQFFYAVLIGIVFGTIYCATGKLRYSIALHILFNTVGMISGEMVGRLDGEITVRALAEHPEVLVWLLFLAAIYGVSLLCTPIAIVFIAPNLRPAAPTVSLPQKDVLRVALLNPALWLLLALIVYLFV